MTLDGASAARLPATPDTPPARRRIWLAAAVVGWAVLLLALAYMSVGSGAPTVREQRGVAEAAPIVDRVLEELVRAGGTDVIVELSAATVDEGCRITPFRDGATVEGAVTFRTSEADGPALLDRIAQRLPANYRASVRHSEDDSVHRLRADAGEFVGVRGKVTSPGVVALTVTTGCRPA